MAKHQVLSRRSMLQASSLLAASAVLSPAAVIAFPTFAQAAPAPATSLAEAPELIMALQKLAQDRRQLAKLENDLDWLEAEWRHRWPSAPEEILGGANGDAFYRPLGTVIEADILGRPIRRDTAELTKRLDKKWRRENERTCFVLETPDDLRKTIQLIISKSPVGRSERTIAKDRARLDKWLRETQRALPLSEQYFTETSRLRQLSGVDQLKESVQQAKDAVSDSYKAIALAPAKTLLGLRAKALVYIAAGKSLFDGALTGGLFNSGYLLALQTVQLTEPADGAEWPPITEAFHDTLIRHASERLGVQR